MPPLLKKVLLHSSVLLFSLCLIISASFAVVYFVADQPSKIKTIVKDSGAYQTLTTSLLEELAKQPMNSSGSIPLNDPIIQQAAKQAFSPEVIQKNTEGFIDGSYQWLNGTTANPVFVLDFSSSKQVFANGVGEYAQSRLSALPKCSYKQIPASVDVFALQCLPPGLNIAQARAQVQSEIVNNQQFLGDTSISGEEISKDIGAPNAVGKESKIPTIYQRSKQAFFIFLALLVPLGAGIVWLSESLRIGLKRLAKTIVKNSIAILILGASFKFLLPKVLDRNELKTNQVADKVLVPLVKEFMQAIGNVYFVFGLITALVAGLIGAFYWFRYLRVPKPLETKV